MDVQKFLFPKPGICTDELLYFRRNGKAYYAWSEDIIYFDREGCAEFDTYFNGFSAEKYFKYTIVGRIGVRLQLEGIFRITLMRKEKLGGKLYTEYISERDVEARPNEEIEIPFESNGTAGMFCIRLYALRDGCKFYGGCYTAEVPEHKIRRVKIGLNICTFKREKFITANIHNLEKEIADPASPLRGRLEVFITDNAQTLPSDLGDPRFVHVFKNKNVGGAGGFTRGLIEIIRDGNPRGITHALFMDDDVILSPSVIMRTLTVLSLLKEEYTHSFVGGAMLRLDEQNVQVESGAVWNTGKIVSLKSGLDLRYLDACLYNELEETADYNAWWYCAVPIENVRADNLPLPVFIRGDDVEYGLRNTKNLILMNGICVWHEPFENKYSSSLFYYIFRNRLIDNAVRGIKYKKREFLRELRQQVITEIYCMRYANAYLLIRGVKDFLRGVDWLKAQDGEVLHKEIMGISYMLKYIEELDFTFSYPKYEQMCAEAEKRGAAALIKRALKRLFFNGLFLKATRKVAVPTVGVRPGQLFLAKKALHYDACSRKGFVTKKSVKKAITHYLRYLKVKIRVIFRYKRTVREFYARRGELTSLAFWNGYLGIDASVQPSAKDAKIAEEAAVTAVPKTSLDQKTASAVLLGAKRKGKNEQ